MKATVNSISEKFEPYTLDKVISVLYGKRTIVLTFVDLDGEISTVQYSDGDVLITVI